MPEHIADAARIKEPKRFAALASVISSEWDQHVSTQIMLKWVPVLSMFLNTKVCNSHDSHVQWMCQAENAVLSVFPASMCFPCV